MTAVPENEAVPVEVDEAEQVLVGELLPAADPAPEPLGVDERGRLSKTQARQLTEAIRASQARTWLLLTIAHDRKAHLVMGYPTWKAYTKAEFDLSESRSHQHLQVGRVMLVLAAAARVDPNALTPVPSRTAQQLLAANVLPTLRRTVTDLVEGHDPVEPGRAITEALQRVLPTLRQRRSASSETPEEPADDLGGNETCPLCEGRGHLGSGPAAQDLAARALAWMARVSRQRLKTVGTAEGPDSSS